MSIGPAQLLQSGGTPPHSLAIQIGRPGDELMSLSSQPLVRLRFFFNIQVYLVIVHVCGKVQTVRLHFTAAAICIIRSVYKARNAPWKLRVRQDGHVTNAAQVTKPAKSMRILLKIRRHG